MADGYFVMVVEDDKLCAALLKHMLSRSGYQVMIVEDGLNAQNKINRLAQPPHLLLLDLMLPFIDGYHLLRQVRSKPAWANTPIIVLSAKNQEQDIIKAFELGASDYVTKPFQINELMARIRSQIKGK